jgi:hypothetical protein
MIVQWLGPLGSFNIIGRFTGSSVHLNSGDVVKATAIGNVLTAYINGVQVAQITDTLYAAGHPGVGFYLGTQGTTVVSDYGWSSFTASD